MSATGPDKVCVGTRKGPKEAPKMTEHTQKYIVLCINLFRSVIGCSVDERQNNMNTSDSTFAASASFPESSVTLLN